MSPTSLWAVGDILLMKTALLSQVKSLPKRQGTAFEATHLLQH